MVINYLKSYDRSFQKLPHSVQEKTVLAIDTFLDFLKTRQKPEGLGLKKLHKDYWEIRLNIQYRIIFQFDKDAISMAFVGDHNEIKKFLRQA